MVSCRFSGIVQKILCKQGLAKLPPLGFVKLFLEVAFRSLALKRRRIFVPMDLPEDLQKFLWSA